MTIRNIEIKHVTESEIPAEFFSERPEFVPYYSCKIATDKGLVRGKGYTKESAQSDAMEKLHMLYSAYSA